MTYYAIYEAQKPYVNSIELWKFSLWFTISGHSKILECDFLSLKNKRGWNFRSWKNGRVLFYTCIQCIFYPKFKQIKLVYLEIQHFKSQ
jgi:hypothetical protein